MIYSQFLLHQDCLTMTFQGRYMKDFSVLVMRLLAALT